MNIFGKIWCRVYQMVFKIAMPMLPYREPKVLESVADIKEVLKENNISKVLIVTDNGVKKLTKSLVDDLKENEITPVVFDSVMPNPTIGVIEEGLKVYLDKECQGIIAFGIFIGNYCCYCCFTTSTSSSRNSY